MLSLTALLTIAGHIPESGWMLTYEGKSSNALIRDRRLAAVIHTRVPATVAKGVLRYFSGPPDPVHVVEHRFVSMSACELHFCPDRSFFWIDTQTGIGLGASIGPDERLRPLVAGRVDRSGLPVQPDLLRIGSNGLSPNTIPKAARAKLIEWLSEHDVLPLAVEFVDSRSKVIRLDVEDFKPSSRFEPPDGGPGFDCAHATGTIELRICADPDLSKADLNLSQLFDKSWHGFDTTIDRDALERFQNDWRARRDAACLSTSDLKACLASAYEEQRQALRRWLPPR